MLVSKAFSQHEERTLARKHALQLMYQGEILEKTPRELIDNGQLVPETQGLGEYALMLLDGAKENLEAIDVDAVVLCDGDYPSHAVALSIQIGRAHV